MESNINLEHWIAEHKKEMAEQLAELVKIKSICRYKPDNPHPFGIGCAKALDYVLNLAGSFGLQTENHDYYCGTATLPGHTGRRLGIFVHLDTAEVGTTWTFNPYSPIIKNGYIFGRGTEDNKGAAVTMLFLLRYLKEADISFSHSIVLVFGCGKKSYMQCVRHYLNKKGAPDCSLIADADFPVCIGEKGSLNAELTCSLTGSSLIDFRAGQAANIVPDQAYALLLGYDVTKVKEQFSIHDNCSVIEVGKYIKITASGISNHAAFPCPGSSAIANLAGILLEKELYDQKSLPVLNFLAHTYKNCYGGELGIDVRDETFGYTTHICGIIKIEHGLMTQITNIRYVPSISSKDVMERVRNTVESQGMKFRLISNTSPSMLDDRLRPVYLMLTELANQMLGTNLQPYTMGGVTYAKIIPRSIPFGINRSDISVGGLMGRGSGHIADECIRIDNMTEGLSVYVQALSKLDTMVQFEPENVCSLI